MFACEPLDYCEPGGYFLIRGYWGCAAGWGRIFNRVTSQRMGSHIFGSFRVKQFFIFTVSKRARMFVNLKNGSIRKNR